MQIFLVIVHVYIKSDRYIPCNSNNYNQYYNYILNSLKIERSVKGTSEHNQFLMLKNSNGIVVIVLQYIEYKKVLRATKPL